MHRTLAAALALTLTAMPAFADAPEVAGATASQGAGGWTFTVSVRHADTGWDHYADGWEVLDGEGERLGYRELLHPHENEQPFTRSLSGVEIPEGTASVTIRAHDSEHGWGEGFELVLD